MSKTKLPTPKTRLRDDSFSQTFNGIYSNKAVRDGNVVFDVTSNRSAVVRQTRQMTDVVTPGFAQRIARGDIISSPMNSVNESYEVISDSGFHIRSTGPGYVQDYKESRCLPFYWGTHPILLTHLPHGIDVSNLQNLVQTKCLADIKTSSLMGIVATAEMGKTLRMILAPFQTLIPVLSYLRQLRKGRVNIAIARKNGRTITVNGRIFNHPQKFSNKGPGRLILPPRFNIIVPAGQMISSTVLMNNLGLRPLMMDLEAFLKDIPNAHKQDRVSYRKTLSTSSTKSLNQTLEDTYTSVQALKTTDTKVTVRCSALVQDRFNVLADFGVSINDIPEAALELIPFSFVADYFVNIGDFLGAARALRVENILAFSTVTTVESKTSRVYSGFTGKAPFLSTILPMTGSDSLTNITKTRSVNVPNPTFAYVPRDQIFRPTVVQNLLSLITQELTKTGKARVFY